MASLILQFNELDPSSVSTATALAVNTGLDIVYESDLVKQPLEAIGAKETLYIVGHSGGTKLGGHTPRELAEILAKGGLGAGPYLIGLCACNTGTGHAPYALELKVELVQSRKIMCSVEAPRGSIGATLAGDFKVLDKSRNEIVDKPYYETTKAF